MKKLKKLSGPNINFTLKSLMSISSLSLVFGLTLLAGGLTALETDQPKPPTSFSIDYPEVVAQREQGDHRKYKMIRLKNGLQVMLV